MRPFPALAIFFAAIMTHSAQQTAGVDFRGSVTNRAPLKQKAYLDLPLGSIQPKGWLRIQLERQRDGLTGDLDEHYAAVVGPRNGWLGGDGDGWERGPYWIDGLLPLAYILKDDKLIAKTKPWVEWALLNQEPSGFFGPKKFSAPPKQEPGIQKTPREDWWPRMVMLKVLQQYHSATGDPRVIDVLSKYFRYQLQELPKTPLDHWSFWGNRRGGDNLAVVYWLYNITGEDYLLKLGQLIHEQTFPWARIFLNRVPAPSSDLGHLYPYNTGNRYPFKQDLIDRLSVSQLQTFHCVNFAQGLKEPLVYFQQNPDPQLHQAVKWALEDVKRFHGQPQGMYGADEPMHGPQPTQGVEFCSIVEMMFSLETMLSISGDLDFADHLELVAYNALPAQATEDFRSRQYFQSANQVVVSRARRNYYEEANHGGTDSCFGLLTGYPCCTCNMHQGWPKLVQNLWYGTPDGGLAALVYGPCELTTKTRKGKVLRITEETQYPFEDEVRFTIHVEDSERMPLRFRLPEWATKESTRVTVNGQVTEAEIEGRLLRLERAWKANDRIALSFAPRITVSRWVENSVAVHRGPLVYALRVGEEFRKISATDAYGDYFEVHPTTPWNYGLHEKAVQNPGSGFTYKRNASAVGYLWTSQAAPCELTVQARRVPEWQLYGSLPGPLPHSGPWATAQAEPLETVTLIPYGCTRLRITEFPVVK